jgi:membrane protease YdiL (CAAX protease family)
MACLFIDRVAMISNGSHGKEGRESSGDLLECDRLKSRRQPMGMDSKRPSQGLLRPDHFFWARAVLWSVVFGTALWIAYKFGVRVGIDLGLGVSGVVLGVLAAFALYVLSVRLIEQRLPDELGLAQLAPELAAGIAAGVALFSAMMGVLLITGAYAMSGPTATAPWQALTGSLEGAVEELIFRGAIFRLLWSALGVWWALGLSSALFGAVHLIKPGADLMAVLGIIVGGGIPMAALYLLAGCGLRSAITSPGISPKPMCSARKFRAVSLALACIRFDRCQDLTPCGAAAISARRHRCSLWCSECWSVPHCLYSRSVDVDQCSIALATAARAAKFEGLRQVPVDVDVRPLRLYPVR